MSKFKFPSLFLLMGKVNNFRKYSNIFSKTQLIPQPFNVKYKSNIKISKIPIRKTLKLRNPKKIPQNLSMALKSHPKPVLSHVNLNSRRPLYSQCKPKLARAGQAPSPKSYLMLVFHLKSITIQKSYNVIYIKKCPII